MSTVASGSGIRKTEAVCDLGFARLSLSRGRGNFIAKGKKIICDRVPDPQPVWGRLGFQEGYFYNHQRYTKLISNMQFEDFLKKLNEDFSPDRAYKLYLQTQIIIIEEILISGGIITRVELDRISQNVLSKVAEGTKK